MITEAAFSKASELTGGLDMAIIKAVAEVESSGNGFLESGEPKILFEPHLFWKYLLRSEINPQLHWKGNEDILYPKWRKGTYGRLSEQHTRLQRAIAIDKFAALKSASWGKFQILGENYILAGHSTLQDFINAMYKNEDEHLFAFINFIKNKRLIDVLKNKDFESFTRVYNGPGQVSEYSKKLENYLKSVADF